MIRKIKILGILLLLPMIFMGSSFLKNGGLKYDINSLTSSISTIVIDSSSLQILRVTGSVPQVVKLPDATTLRPGFWYNIINESSAPITISNSSSTQINIISSSTVVNANNAILYLTSNATTGGPWSFTMNSFAPTNPLTETGGVVTVDWASDDTFSWTLNANCTINFTHQSSGQVIVMRITNTGSNFTVTWPSIKWATGAAPTQTIGATSDVITCFYEGTNTYCNSVQDMH